MWTPDPNLFSKSFGSGLQTGSQLAQLVQDRRDRRTLSELEKLMQQGQYEQVGAGLVGMGQVGQGVNVANIPYMREQQRLQQEFQNQEAQRQAEQQAFNNQMAMGQFGLAQGRFGMDQERLAMERARLEAAMDPNSPLNQAKQGAPTFGKSPVYLTDPETGEVRIGAMGDDGSFRVVDTGGLVPATGVEKVDLGDRWGFRDKRTGEVVGYEQKRLTEAAAATELGKATMEAAQESFKDLGNVNSSLSNINEAIAALDRGANAGLIYKRLPKVSEASASLENAMNRMGLDVIGSVTFGALSEGEMRLAMETAVPRNLGPQELREWLTAKRDAQLKAQAALQQAAIYLSTPGNTINTWLREQNAQQPAVQVPGAPQSDPEIDDLVRQYGG